MDNNTTPFEEYIAQMPKLNMIDELHLGHIGTYSAHEELCKAEYIKTLATLAESANTLKQDYTDSQKKLLDKLCNLAEVSRVEQNINAYNNGFRLGVCLGYESSQHVK